MCQSKTKVVNTIECGQDYPSLCAISEQAIGCKGMYFNGELEVDECEQ